MTDCVRIVRRNSSFGIWLVYSLQMPHSRKVTARWICALALVLSSVVPVSLAAPAQAAPSRTFLAKYESQVLVNINNERARRGIRKLTLRACPDRYAERWASTIRTSTMRHQNLMPVLSGCDASRVAENLVRGNVGWYRAVKLWMGSPGHRRNILDARFTQIGLATVYANGQYTTVAVFSRG